MAAESEEYLAVLKASYDYDPQAEGEIPIKENQLLFLVEKTDEDWWKVKVKGESQEEESPVGLVPAAYVEPANHTFVVKAIYDYDANAPGELTVKEDETLLVFDTEEEWLLVQSQKEGGKAGFVPGNYVEASGEEEVSSTLAPMATQIIIPPSPPRPVSTYMDPADRVAAASIKADDIKTWSVSEIDKKGKKKKGTLGIGNGAVFFASDADKTPVQKWRTVDMESINIDKSKHVHIDLGGPTPTSLHFNAGSKDTADAIATKLRSSKILSAPAPRPDSHGTHNSRPPPLRTDISDHGKKTGASVHFSEQSPVIIPPREPSEDGDYEAPEEHPDVDGHGEDDEGGDVQTATALYDFHADGEDELSVREGEQLIVLEIDGDEWWKCKNDKGNEGVVPASYIELTSSVAHVAAASTSTDTDDEAEVARAAKARAEEARSLREQKMERERKEKDRLEKQRKEKERAAKEREDVAKEKERAEKERAAEERKKREAEQRSTAAAAEERRQRPKSVNSPSQSETRPKSQSSRMSTEATRPPPDSTRVWHDRSGQFRVEAAFMGFNKGKLRLHKINGVVVEVPAEKMSVEDMRYVETLTSRKSVAQPADHSDDEPLGNRRKVSQPAHATSARSAPSRKSPKIDWFDFFLSAGCDIDDCTRYTSSFERDKIDEAILPDITDATMRSLGLREGDIIRVTKAIEKRKQQESKTSSAQLLRDEEYAKQLQSEEDGSRKQQTTSPAPNLFAGAGGALKNNTTRRGRPQPSKSLPPASVDLNAIATASDQIQRTTSPQIGLSASSPPASSPPVQPPIRSSSALATTSSGFDDDAWTNRPSSTRPLAPTPPVATTRAPSAPPAPSAPTPPVTIVPQPRPSTSIQPAQPQSGSNLAKTTESDIFDQLSRLTQLGKQSPAVNPPSISSPSSIVNLPASYHSGLGMGSSPAPIGQHLQNQQIGFLQPLQPMSNGPRGPFAPVPANQNLLQPLIPTNTGFKSFVPTRPANNAFQNQPSFLPQQPTGFSGASQNLVSQPTGMPFGGYGTGSSFPNNSFAPVQSSSNPGFSQLPSNNGIFSPPPVLPLPTNNTSPANIFAQMKSGTFATGSDTTNPQPSDKYDALRPNTLVPQVTGWGAYQTVNGGYHMGYQQ